MTGSAKTQAQYPVFVRCYDLLMEGGEDTRDLPFDQRRVRLEALVKKLDPAWERWLDLGLDPSGGFDSAAEALSTLPTRRRATESRQPALAAVRSVFGRIRATGR